MKKEQTETIDPSTNPHFKQESLPVHVYNVAVWGLVIITLISVIGIIILSFYDKKASEGLISIASACASGLVVIFSQRASSNSK